jgi:hypothetical protein
MGMRTRWGMDGLVVWWLMAGLAWAPIPAQAANGGFWINAPGWRLPVLPAAAQNSMEAQLLGDHPATLTQPSPGLTLRGPALGLPPNLEMKISVLYSQDPAQIQDATHRYNSLLFKSSVGYQLLPNLQVGLSGYFFRSREEEGLGFSRPLGDRVMGLGPEIKYDLGSWNFVLKSQMETGSRDGRDRSEDLQNWFRVWRAF